MSEKIKITCPRCKHKWEKSLPELEEIKTIYRGDEKEKTKRKVVEYRAVCPVDGTFVIVKKPAKKRNCASGLKHRRLSPRKIWKKPRGC